MNSWRGKGGDFSLTQAIFFSDGNTGSFHVFELRIGINNHHLSPHLRA